jgi:hypothetical protein
MALTFTEVKRFPPRKGGIREGLIDITFDSSYVNAGYPITPADLTLNAIDFMEGQGDVDGYSFEYEPQSSATDGIKLKAYRPKADTLMMPCFGAWAVDGDGVQTNGAGLVGDATETEQAAALCKVYDAGNTAYLNVSGSSAGDDITADYQLASDTKNDNDAVYFGGAVPFAYLSINMSATVQTYTDDALVWEYYNGSTWSTLTLAYDGTDATAQDGKRSFGRDGAITFVPPVDWNSVAVDSQTAYWIRARIDTNANVGTVGLMDSVEHYLVTPADGIVAPFSISVTGVRLTDSATTLHTTADVKFIIMNFTTGAHSGELTFAQDKRHDSWSLTALSAGGLVVTKGDTLGVIVTQEDGTNEPLDVLLELTGTPGSEELASGAATLSGKTVRVHYIGS